MRCELGDTSVAQMLERGQIDIKMASRKVLTLHEVLFVPSIWRT